MSRPRSKVNEAMRFARRGVLLVALGSNVAAPQAGLPLYDDASMAPRQSFRIRVSSAWARFDETHTRNGPAALGAPYTASAFGSAQLPALGATESLIAAATAQPFTLSLGASRLDARGRQEVVPIALEYGITDRITVGAMLPIVRRRVAVQFLLDSLGANVGPNLHRSLGAAQSANALVQSQFTAAASQLQSRLQSCQANPSGAGCGALLARQAEAQALIAASQSFASAVAGLYGSTGSLGTAFVPTRTSAAHAGITARVAGFNAQYRDLLASGADLITAVPFPAGGPAGSAELQEFLTTDLGGDSLATAERSGVGNVELGVRALVLDRPHGPERRVGMRVLTAVAARLATSSQQSPSPIMDLRLDAGAPSVEGRLIADLTAGRAGVLGGVEGIQLLGEQPNAPDARSARFGYHVAPRFQLSAPFSVHATYAARGGPVDGTEQYVGGGIAFQSPGGSAGRALPLEMRFTHLQSLGGPAGQPKFTRDQLEVRLSFSPWR